MTVEKKLFIRADASSTVGTGHIMRSIALAQAAMRQQMPVRMFCRANVDWVRERLAKGGIAHTLLPGAIPYREEPEELVKLLCAQGASVGDWVCLDGYHFGTECHNVLRSRGYQLLVIDDYAHLPEYYCDILLNQNIGEETTIYTGDIGCKLLGPGFALLREEFIEARSKLSSRSFPPVPLKLLISLGGGEQMAALERVTAELHRAAPPSLTIRVVLGGMDEKKVRQVFQSFSCAVEFLDQVEDMPGVMAWADYAITAGGSTCWELCCMGTPFTVLALADNQRGLTRSLLKNGVATPLSSLDLVFSGNADELFAEQSLKGRSLVRGGGADAVIQACRGELVRLRKICFDDRDFLLDMINKPEIRKFGGSPRNVTKEEHDIWFRAHLNSLNSYSYIFYITGFAQPAGYIRFDLSGGRGILSIALDPCLQGRGYGCSIIMKGCKVFAHAAQDVAQSIIAEVRKDNPRALHVFEKAGFRRTGKIIEKDKTSLIELSLNNINNLL